MARVQKAGGGAATPGRAPTGPAKKPATGHAGATGAAATRAASAPAKARTAPATGAAKSGAPAAKAAPKPAAPRAAAASAVPKTAAKGGAKAAPVPAAKPASKGGGPAAKAVAKPAVKSSPAPAAKSTPAPPAKAAVTAAVKPAPKSVVKTAPKAAAKAAPAPPVKAPARKEAPRRSGPLDKFLVEQRQLLFEERATHLRQAESLKEEADALAAEMEPGESEFGEEGGEGGNLSVERELDLVLSAQAKASVDEIDRALLKIDVGTYGLCEKCGKEIPKLRLKALPHAPLCVACKSGGLSRR